MEFPEKDIYKEIEDELTDKAYYFTSKEHTPVAHFDWDRVQYEAEGERKEFPFDRPAVFVRFGEMPYETEGLRKRGTIPIIITVVQDKYVDSAKDSPSQADYLKLLEYKYLINDVLNEFRGTCFNALTLISMETDHENRNLHVERIRYECKVTLKRNVVPLPEP